IIYGYDGLPMQQVASPSPDYVPGLEHPPSPNYVPGPQHPPSPIEEDPEVDHADYPADGGDGEDKPSDNDNDDDDDDDTDDEDEEPFEDEDDDEEDEEHLALADSSVVPVVDPIPSAGDTEAFEMDESAPTPKSPHTKIPSPPLHVSSPPLPLPLPTVDIPTYAEALPGYRAAEIRLRASSPSTHHPLHPSSPHLSPPVPISLPLPSSPLLPLPASLFIPSLVDHMEDIPGAKLPPRKRLCLTALTSRYEVGESSTAAPEVAPTTLEGVNAIVTVLAAFQEQDTQDIYAVIEDTQDRQTQLFQRVDGLVEDRQFHNETARMTHTQMEDYHIASQESLMTTLIAHVSSLQGQTYAAKEDSSDLCKGLLYCKMMLRLRCPAAPMTAAAVEQLIKARVSAALANHETLRNSTNDHGDGSHNSDTGIRGTIRTPRECMYKDFLNCKSLTFKGTKGVVVLSQWFEKMESVFHISNYAVENQVKFVTCTFLRNALTWWDSHMKTVTQDVAYAMDWKALK
ncbi:hypothetical protein Tco_1381839, partial [Tanacetum coccineum]